MPGAPDSSTNSRPQLDPASVHFSSSSISREEPQFRPPGSPLHTLLSHRDRSGSIGIVQGYSVKPKP